MNYCRYGSIAIAVGLALVAGAIGCRAGLPEKSPVGAADSKSAPAAAVKQVAQSAPRRATRDQVAPADQGPLPKVPSVAPVQYVADEPVQPAQSMQVIPFDGSVSTVVTPEIPKRPISLAEAVALTLENGRTGELYDNTGGVFAGGAGNPAQPILNTDSIRVFAYDPAIVGSYIDQSLAKFDPVLRTGTAWNHYDRSAAIEFPGLTAIGPFGPFGPFGPAVLPDGRVIDLENDPLDILELRTELVKPLPTGGVAGLGFRHRYVDYDFPFLSTRTHRPVVEFTFEQPLLQGAGVFINQIRDTHPGGFRNPVPVGGGAPGILLARVSYNHSQLEFEQRVHQLLFTVEEAYWQLYRAYWELYSREVAMRQAQATFQVAKTRFDQGDPATGREDLAQIEQQYHAIRAQRIEALGAGLRDSRGVLEAERRLRYVLGLPMEDGMRLVPADSPTTAPTVPDWSSAVAQATALRPELMQVQEQIRAAELLLARAQNERRPDLRFISKYNTSGLDSDAGEAYDEMGDFETNTWELGLVMQMQTGFREANAKVARARVQVARHREFLNEKEQRILSTLQRSFRDVVQLREEMQIRRSAREAAAMQVDVRFRKFREGAMTLDTLLDSQRAWADALRDEFIAVCNYNIALADHERQKGTILAYHNVAIAQGPLPTNVHADASHFIRHHSYRVASRKPDAATPAAGLPDARPHSVVELLKHHEDLPASLSAP